MGMRDAGPAHGHARRTAVGYSVCCTVAPVTLVSTASLGSVCHNGGTSPQLCRLCTLAHLRERDLRLVLDIAYVALFTKAESFGTIFLLALRVHSFSVDPLRSGTKRSPQG